MNCHRLNRDSDVRTLLRVVVSYSCRAVVTPCAIWDERTVIWIVPTQPGCAPLRGHVQSTSVGDVLTAVYAEYVGLV